MTVHCLKNKKMKHWKITLVFFLFLGTTLSGQTIFKGEIIYRIDNQKLNSLKSKQSKVNTPRLRKLIKNDNTPQYRLVFNEKESFFEKEKKVEAFDKKKMSLTEIMIGKGSYYTNIETKNILLQKQAYGERFIISIKQKKWKITQETKKIGDYLCHKATTTKMVEGRWGKKILNVSAWFTSKIPVNYGPKNYQGLPGLILELNENGIVYTVAKITLNPKKNISIIKPTQGKKVTNEEYHKISRKMFNDFRKRRRSR